ncbi:MAG: phosphonate ABC transporter, permease protein PhnE [Bdellovibrionaceae bacterium]|nr:phosphonate ABC transporter, permease protein PhnE [Pseudobdellovibrionaceae bacterium]
MKMNSFTLRRSIFDGLTFGFLICILLIVVANPTDEEWLNLSKNSLIVLASFLFSMILSEILNRKSIKTLGEALFEPDYKKVVAPEMPWYMTFSKWQLIILLITLFVVGVKVTDFSLLKLLDEDGYNGVKRIFTELLNPNFQLLPHAVLRMFETIFMAFLATAFAIPIAFVLSFMAAKNIMKHPLAFTVYLLIRTLLNVIRSVEAFMWAIIFSVWVGIGAGAGMLALMVHSIASLAKQYSEIVETVSEGPIEGIQATGASKLQMIWYAIVPQVVLPYISFTVYRWDINVRMATIVGFVGGGGIGKLLIAYQGQAMWREMGCIFFVIAIVVWLLDQGSAYIREALK